MISVDIRDAGRGIAGPRTQHGADMMARPPRSRHRGAWAATITLVIMLVSLAIPLEASQPLHLHEAGTAGAGGSGSGRGRAAGSVVSALFSMANELLSLVV